MFLNTEFLEAYSNLSLDRYYSYRYSRDYTHCWKMDATDIRNYLEKGTEGMDFIWHALLLNLYAKTVYVYAPGCYSYCEDFIHWKYGAYHTLHHIYRAKLSRLTDFEIPRRVSPESYAAFKQHSQRRMTGYAQLWKELFHYFDRECCTLNYGELQAQFIGASRFTEEFSDTGNNLSGLLLNELRKTN